MTHAIHSLKTVLLDLVCLAPTFDHVLVNLLSWNTDMILQGSSHLVESRSFLEILIGRLSSEAQTNRQHDGYLPPKHASCTHGLGKQSDSRLKPPNQGNSNKSFKMESH